MGKTLKDILKKIKLEEGMKKNMMKNSYEPLKNKKWLFPETGKAGFHYDDVSNAVIGLKKELINSYSGLHLEELTTYVEKWFPDIEEEKQTPRIKQPITEETIQITTEKQMKILSFS